MPCLMNNGFVIAYRRKRSSQGINLEEHKTFKQIWNSSDWQLLAEYQKLYISIYFDKMYKLLRCIVPTFRSVQQQSRMVGNASGAALDLVFF